VHRQAVNPVLREGNSDRRAPNAVKEYARKNPHSMAEWSQASRSHVSHMHHGDFYHGEKSMTLDRARDVQDGAHHQERQDHGAQAQHQAAGPRGDRQHVHEQEGAVAFYEREIEDARKTGVMFSLHVKATMMKVSHPIVFGHCVKIFYREAFEKHAKLFEELGVNVNNGMADLYTRSPRCPRASRTRSSATCTPATSTAPSWPWWTRPRASPTSIRPTTSSSTPPCPP
jgi:isocitrate dehydrogenase